MTKEVTEKLAVLLRGRIPEQINTREIADDNKRELAVMFNQLIGFMSEIHNFIFPLSKGEIGDVTTSRNNFLASPFKELHSRLLHLTWQAKQVACGDYNQRVDFMGDFSEAFNAMIDALENREKQLKNKIDELESANHYIDNLEGMLPICANCKKIRVEGTAPGEKDQWVQIESYISKRTHATFTHSICPECTIKLYPNFVGRDK